MLPPASLLFQSEDAFVTFGTPPVLRDLAGDRAAAVADGTPVLLDQGQPLVVIDPDSDGMEGTILAVSILGGSAAGERLTLREGGGLAIQGSDILLDGLVVGAIVSDGIGQPLRIRLASLANDYVASLILQNVTYATDGNGHSALRQIEFTVTAGIGEEDAAVALVDVAGVNIAPVLSGLEGDRVAYAAGNAPVWLDRGDAAAVWDPDGPYENGILSVSAEGASLEGEVLALAHQGDGAGQVGVHGSQVTFGGVAVGAIASDGNGRALTLVFNAAASAEAVTAIVRDLTYANTSPSIAGDRRFVIAFRDGLGAEGRAHVTVSLPAPNAAPHADPDQANVAEDASVSGDVLANDSDPENGTLTLTAVSSESAAGAPGSPLTGRFGTLVLRADGTYTYVADRADDLILGETAVETFRYRISDGASSAEATLSLVVQGADEQLWGDAGSNFLVGGRGADQLHGLAGDDRLDGRAGGDRLVGGAGNDIYVVDNARDLVIEAGAGRDTVLTSVSYALAATAPVEVLRTTNRAGTAPIKLTGSAIANTLEGNAGANVLAGKGGNDVLRGGAGRDRFIFDTAPNTGANVDRIVDFSVRDDTVVLKVSVFKGLKPGPLPSSLFFRDTGPASVPDGNDRVVYDAVTGFVHFDRDGAGGADPVAFVRLAKGLKLTAGDFLVI